MIKPNPAFQRTASPPLTDSLGNMDPRISYVENVLGFMFEHGLAPQFEVNGSPMGDLEVWHRNAVVYQQVTRERPVAESQRVRLVTLIEAVRFEAMWPPPFDEPAEFDVSVYEFSEDVLAYKLRIIEEVLLQEAESASAIDRPADPGLLQ